MNTKFENSFVVMPKDCNYLAPMIFGGAFMAQLDLCAASCVSRLLHDSECDSAVTYEADFRFVKAAECGDLVFMEAEIVELRQKGIGVNVKAYRERRATEGKELVATAHFVFVSKKNGEFHPHGLKL